MKFDPPGFLTDLNAEGAEEWSRWISGEFDRVRARDGAVEGLTNYGPRMQFFNPLKTAPGADAVEKDITWSAFPRIVQLQSISDRDRWTTADSTRDAQDEYCEWSMTRDPQTDKITKITFTSEGPEYWQFFAAIDPEGVLALYRRHIGPQVKRTDLFRNGRYITRNRWNNSTRTGVMHLIQPNNTLSAEIELAAGASIVREVGGQPVTDTQQLIECGAYGQAERHSDPTIGAAVNELARQKADVTLANPVGLYIGGLSVAGWETPDGSNALDYWSIERGTRAKALRAVYEVPADRNFVVGDIKIAGRRIEFGAQVADFITIKLTGVATRFGKSTVQPMNGCVRERRVADAVAAPSVEDAVRRAAFTER